MKKYDDGYRKDIQFEAVVRVFLKLRPYRQMTVASRRNEKLARRYFGPYDIAEKIGEVAYHLRLPLNTTIYLVFHVSQFSKVVWHHRSSSKLPTTLTTYLEVILEYLEFQGVR